MKPYMEAFPDTLLVNPWGKAIYNDVYKWAIDQGVSIRRDGIFKYSDGKECAMAYGKLPTIFEYTANYNWMKQNDLWSQEALLQYVQNGKPSYMQFDPDMYAENTEFCNMLANKMGYYFKMQQGEFENTKKVGDTLNIKLNFKNEGVAPLYEPCTVYIGLLDENNQLVHKYKTEIDAHKWMPDTETTEQTNIILNEIQPGKYKLAYGLYYNENDENPTYLLGNTGKIENKWYLLGEIDISERQEVYNLEYNGSKIIQQNEKNVIQYSIQDMDNNAEYYLKTILNGVEIAKNRITSESGNVEFTLDKLGNNNIKVIILKKEDEVANIEKDIYVIKKYNNQIDSISNEFNKEYQQISAILSKDVESNQKINEIQSEIKEDITQHQTEELIDKFYNAEIEFINQYKDNKLEIKYEQLETVVLKLNDISKLLEDLLMITTETYISSESISNNIENLLNTNQITQNATQKLLECSKEYSNVYNDVISIEETSNIKSKVLNSRYMQFKNIERVVNALIELYLQDNSYITYTTQDWTNEDVYATINVDQDTKIDDNQYKFTQNGEFIFKYTRFERNYTKTATVTWIDKNPPIIEDVEDEKIYSEEIIPSIKDNESKVSFKIYKDDKEIENYELGQAISEIGKYSIVAIDEAGNTTNVNFRIEKNDKITSDIYSVDDTKIARVKPQTTVEELKNNIHCELSYTIKDVNDKELEDDSYIGTRCKIIVETGREYTVVVLGDSDGNGQADLIDVGKAPKIYLEILQTDEIEKLVYDLDGNDQVELVDVGKLPKVYLGVLDL